MKREIKSEVRRVGCSGDWVYFRYTKEFPPVGTRVTISWEEPDPEHRCDKMSKGYFIKYENCGWNIRHNDCLRARNVSLCPWCGKELNNG